jgi:hypothetical protein
MEPRFCEKCGAGLEGQPSNCPRCGFQIQKKGMSTCAIVGIVVAIVSILGVMVIGILAAILVPNFIRAKAQGQMTACCSNLRNIGTALEMWSSDNKGHYPDRLEQVAPSYLRTIPTCPSAGIDTYSASYSSTKADPGQRTKDFFSVCCKGEHHREAGAAADFPRYNSLEGLNKGVSETTYRRY